MSAIDTELSARLLSFPIDEGAPDLTFEARLARENGWNLDFARRVVTEYKRFVFLAMSAGHTVTPSDHVDQAWHLHLTYTRSYWERMCGELLGRPLHHGPTRGGAAESNKFRDLYARTLASYRAAFGEDPPADVWPPVDVRFGDDLHFVRVNTVRNWVVPKAAVRRAALVASIGFVVACTTGCNAAVNPFNLTATDFEWFLVPLLVAAFMLGSALSDRLRGPGEQPGDDEPELNWEAAAYLAGRQHRLLTAAIARLVATGAARVSPDGKYLEVMPDAPVPTGLSAVEAEVMRWLPLGHDPAALTEVAEHVKDRFADRVAELRRSGYLLSKGRTFACGIVAVLPVVAVAILLGGTRLADGLQTDKPVGVLINTLLITAVVAFFVFLDSMDCLSRRGVYALNRLLARGNAALTSESTPEAVGASVGLFGTAALAGCALVDLAAVAAWYPGPTGGGSGTSSGGCGGCGCGGCGGCGG